MTKHEKTIDADEIIAKMIKDFPIPDSKRKIGKWLPKNADIPNKCSECGCNWDYDYVFGTLFYTGNIPNFCPNCGKRMLKEGERE